MQEALDDVTVPVTEDGIEITNDDVTSDAFAVRDLLRNTQA